MEIIIATNNQGKVREFKNRLKDYEVFSLKDKNIDIEVEEDGKTFEENAIKKARTISDMTGALVMADDSGLEVFALDNAPGIYSARYGGEGLDDKGRYEKLLKDLEGKTDRDARFVSVIALCFPDGRNVTLRGECYGEITTAPDGDGGFGYDPIFYYPPLKKTFGTLTLEEKNEISHRARALDKMELFFKDEMSCLENEYLRLEIGSKGGEILHLINKSNGENLMNTDLKSWDYVAPVCFPVLGEVPDDTYYYQNKKYLIDLHGFAHLQKFSLVSASENSVTYRLNETEYSYKSWPFRFSLEITYTLTGKKVETLYKVTNNDDKQMFFNIGGHDTYAITTDYENYSLEYEKEEEIPKNCIYTNNRQFFEALPEKAKTFPVMMSKDRAIAFFTKDLKSSWVQLNYKDKPVVRVYFEREKTDSLGFWNEPNSKFYCIEPWAGIHEECQTTNITEEKTNLRYLEPNEEYTYYHSAEYFL
ncbi:MAG: XTP/dITP diphosphatase [Clostridia bacterium]|nr:XTP/dITP diphosphatase [Clostridia bacterium]